MTNPLFVAIDTPDLGRAEALCSALSNAVGGFKLGLEFYAAQGPAGVARISSFGLPLFLDLKLHDIPNTVAKAVAALAPLEPAILTVHAGGGEAMMRAAKEAAPPGTRVVGVTVLTSLDDSDLAALGIGDGAPDHVSRLARLAHSAGLDGIVCSGIEVERARQHWPAGFFVVPGIRPAGEDSSDQKRIVTPAQAIARGASVLVVGRPITDAPDPALAARAISDSLKDPVQ